MMALLHPALRLLWRLQFKAGWRKFTRSARTGKGILRLILTIGVFALMFGPMIVFSIYREEPDPAAARALIEPGILLFTILILIGSGSNSGIFFTPAEVDFLFSGPFHRRELILYRLGHQAQASLLGAVFLSVAPAAFVPHWIFGFLGIALVLQFIQLLSVVLSLSMSIVGQTVYTRARKAVLAAIAVTLLVGVWQAVADHAAGGLFAMIRSFGQTTAGRAVLLPFQVFSRTIAAESFYPEFAGWGALNVAINAALVVLAVRLDADFYERSIAVSEKVYRAIQRARRGQAWMGLSKPSATRWRLPMPGRLKGAGPIAWRQSVSALRSSRGVIYAVLAMTAAAAIPAFALGDNGTGMSISVLAMLSVFTLPQMLQFDFRGDIERIELLKTLPATAGAITGGELLAPVVAATIIECVVILVTGFLWTDFRTIVAICVFALPANLILFALENVLFLYYPRRYTNPNSPFQAPGRQMVTNFIKFIAVAVAAGVIAASGAATYWVSGQSLSAALLAAWCVAAALGVMLVQLAARAFRALDPSLETFE
jgi:hypothetical protein